MKDTIFFWLVIALLFLISELGHPGLFFFLSFSFGALISALISVWYDSWIIQSTAFLVGAIISFFVLKRWVRVKMRKDRRDHLTNVYALQGKKGTVIESILPDKPGYVQINGERWTARSVHTAIIEQGVQVIVIDVRGAHVIVEEVLS